jgi:hypothetical protein
VERLIKFGGEKIYLGHRSLGRSGEKTRVWTPLFASTDRCAHARVRSIQPEVAVAGDLIGHLVTARFRPFLRFTVEGDELLVRFVKCRRSVVEVPRLTRARPVCLPRLTRARPVSRASRARAPSPAPHARAPRLPRLPRAPSPTSARDPQTLRVGGWEQVATRWHVGAALLHIPDFPDAKVV